MNRHPRRGTTPAQPKTERQRQASTSPRGAPRSEDAYAVYEQLGDNRSPFAVHRRLKERGFKIVLVQVKRWHDQQAWEKKYLAARLAVSKMALDIAVNMPEFPTLQNMDSVVRTSEEILSFVTAIRNRLFEALQSIPIENVDDLVKMAGLMPQLLLMHTRVKTELIGLLPGMATPVHPSQILEGMAEDKTETLKPEPVATAGLMVSLDKFKQARRAAEG